VLLSRHTRRCMAALWLTLALLGQVEAQMPDRIYRLGILATEEAAIETWRAATLPELARLGFSERRNLFLDAGTSRPGGARLGARPLLTTAHQLVAVKPDVLRSAANWAGYSSRLYTERASTSSKSNSAAIFRIVFKLT